MKISLLCLFASLRECQGYPVACGARSVYRQLSLYFDQQFKNDPVAKTMAGIMRLVSIAKDCGYQVFSHTPAGIGDDDPNSGGVLHRFHFYFAAYRVFVGVVNQVADNKL